MVRLFSFFCLSRVKNEFLSTDFQYFFIQMKNLEIICNLSLSIWMGYWSIFSRVPMSIHNSLRSSSFWQMKQNNIASKSSLYKSATISFYNQVKKRRNFNLIQNEQVITGFQYWSLRRIYVICSALCQMDTTYFYGLPYKIFKWHHPFYTMIL